MDPETASDGGRLTPASWSRLLLRREARHSADQFRWNLRRAPGFGRNEHQDLLYGHAQFAMMGRLDANLAGGAANFHGPQIECQSIPKARRLGKIDGEMHRGRQNLLVMK